MRAWKLPSIVFLNLTLFAMNVVSGWGDHTATSDGDTAVPSWIHVSPEAEEALLSLQFQFPQRQVEAPDIELEDLDGELRRLSSYRGKLVFLNFWATWCAPCRAEMPAMETLYDKLKDDGLAMIAVDLQENRELVEPFVAELALTFDISLDRSGVSSRSFAVRALPMSYLIGKDGRILTRMLGARTWDTPEVLALFRELLAE